MNTTPHAKCTLIPLVNEYVRTRLARGIFNARTGRCVHYDLVNFAQSFGARPLTKLNVSVIEKWMEIGHLAPSTRRNRLSYVRVFCDWLVDKGHIKRNPTKDFPPISLPRRVPVTFQQNEVAKVIAACGNDRRGLAIVWMMVGLGCRCVEVSRADIDDYDRVAKTIKLRGKAGHERILPVPDEVAAALDAYHNETGRSPGPIIRQINRKGGYTYDRLSPQTISDYMTRVMRKAEVKGRIFDGKSAHGLRRTAASDVMDRTGNIQIVQALLGHAKIETTTIYLRPVPLDDLRDAMAGRGYRHVTPAADRRLSIV